MSGYRVFFILLSVWALPLAMLAQPYAADDRGLEPVENAAAIGLTILSNPTLSVSTVDQYRNGITVDHTTLQLSISLGLTWSLQVRLTDNLRYQTNSIPASALGIRALNLSNRPEVLLSTADQMIASGLANLPISLGTTFRYRLQGGNALLKPGGSYTTTLVFSCTGL
ncbi:hypothetical protein [Fibrivirga algicola]|uniref:Fimbrial protein n=1 Tax=Fibrivirga algicola TaxID=2950420 RepID=A0ABX0QG05_9BACT|nr:hypothetical protein [Fibrivirga algicola]NID10977.1 hypothetical protein [Fibrivirga algicola]